MATTPETAAVPTAIEILGRVLDPEHADLSPEAARSILALKFRPKDVDRMNVLSEKARTGSLTQNEERELDNFIYVNDILTLLRARASQALKEKEGARS
jgi:hypothetical protein